MCAMCAHVLPQGTSLVADNKKAVRLAWVSGLWARFR
jgi:hypothetical protein